MANQVIVNSGGCGIKSSMAIGNLQKTRYGVPTVKWEGISSQGKVLENQTKYWKIQGISDKYYLLFFSDI